MKARYAHEVDIYDPNENPETVRAAEFFLKLDHEGGYSGLLGYGGADAFPEELRPLALQADRALEGLREAANVWGEERGVSY